MGLRAEPHTKPPSKLTELIFIPIFAQMILVTRKEHFNAAHKLENPNWTDEKNREVFGKCANKNWHGHNYQLFITVKGEPDPETGYVTDLKKMSTTIREHIKIGRASCRERVVSTGRSRWSPSIAKKKKEK